MRKPIRDASDALDPQRGVVQPLGFVGDDAALVAAVRKGHPGAKAALFDRYAGEVRRVLFRILGADAELADVIHDVFVHALEGIEQLASPSALRAWLRGVAVFTARRRIRTRMRRRWLRLFTRDEQHDDDRRPAPVASPETQQALRAAYRIFDRMPPDDRIALTLRLIDGMELTEVAAACSVSLATIKRRLKRAEHAFVVAARKEPALAEWLEGGSRWSVK